jgi:hypothetical protein
MTLLDALLDLLFPPGNYGKRSRTKLGIEVRSGAERQIADYFQSIGMRYEYERELEARFWIFRKKISCPDFYLPDHDVYVEYWGMLGVENRHERAKYERSMKYKMARYHQLGVKFISLYPRDLAHLDRAFRERFTSLTGKSPTDCGQSCQGGIRGDPVRKQA